MARLNWVRQFEYYDQDSLQECFTEKEHGLLQRGQIVKLCSGCKQWVSIHDLKNYCSQGLHEYAIPVNVEV